MNMLMVLGALIGRTARQGVWWPVAYSLFSIVAFTVGYRLAGVEKHFELMPELQKKPWFASFYISAMAQCNAIGDATPKTVLGRSLFLSQVLMGWLWFMVIAVVLADVTVLRHP